MTDYLELLLKLAEEEERAEAPALPDGEALPEGIRQAGRDEGPEPAQAGAPTTEWTDGGGRMGISAAAPGRRGMGPGAEESKMAERSALRAGAAGAEDAERAASEDPFAEQDGGQTAFAEELLARLGTARAPGSAGALERRLARFGSAVPPAAGAVRREQEADGAGEGPDLEELDRRLERDARRYDGGMGLY